MGANKVLTVKHKDIELYNKRLKELEKSLAAAREEVERLRDKLNKAKEYLAEYAINDPDPERSLNVADFLLKVSDALEKE